MLKTNINKWFYYGLFLCIITPIFINLNISAGLRFDANPYNQLGLPSIPISLIVIFAMTIYKFKTLFEVKFILFILLMILFLSFNILNGTGTRAVIVFFGMLIPIVSYYLFCKVFVENVTLEIYKILYKSLLIVFFVKLISDLVIFGKIVSPMFILKSIMIYNYFDYFPFFYYLLLVLSIYNILYLKYYKKLSIVVIILISIITVKIDSRLYQYGILLIPFLLITYSLIKLKLNVYYNLFFILVVSITLIIGLNDISPSEASLSERFEHWSGYLKSFNIWNFLFPFYNEYRSGYASYGSLHNEILEQFSYYGLIVIYYYLVMIKEMFINVEKSFRIYSFLLMFILVFGALIQSNFTNPYIGVLLGLVLAIFSKNRYKGK